MKRLLNMTSTKPKLLAFLNGIDKVPAFIMDAKASGYAVSQLNKMILTIECEYILDDGIIIHKNKQRTNTDWNSLAIEWRKKTLQTPVISNT